MLGVDRRIEAKGPHQFEMRNISWAYDGDAAAMLNGDETEIGIVFLLELLRFLKGVGAEGVKRILVERICSLLPECPLRKEQKKEQPSEEMGVTKSMVPRQGGQNQMGQMHCGLCCSGIDLDRLGFKLSGC